MYQLHLAAAARMLVALSSPEPSARILPVLEAEDRAYGQWFLSGSEGARATVAFQEFATIVQRAKPELAAEPERTGRARVHAAAPEDFTITTIADAEFDAPLTLREAFHVMCEFLAQLNARGPVESDLLASWLTLEADGGTTDPAQLDDFLQSAQAVRDETALRSAPPVDDQAAEPP